MAKQYYKGYPFVQTYELSFVITEDCDTAGAEVREYKVEIRCVDKRAWVELGRTRETQYRAEK